VHGEREKAPSCRQPEHRDVVIHATHHIDVGWIGSREPLLELLLIS
jgi:hypothetical protein